MSLGDDALIGTFASARALFSTASVPIKTSGTCTISLTVLHISTYILVNYAITVIQ